MAHPERYDATQWQKMTEPGAEERMRGNLSKYVRAYFDSAPEGAEIARFQSVLLMIRRYFEEECRSSVENHEISPRFLKAQIVLEFLQGATFLNTDGQIEAAHLKNIEDVDQTPPCSAEQIKGMGGVQTPETGARR